MSQDNQRLGHWKDCGMQATFHENPADPDALTMRDRFAMSALMGIVGFQTSFGHCPENLELRAWVADAYRCADAMLLERAKPKEPK